jgi:hypothetical protein
MASGYFNSIPRSPPPPASQKAIDHIVTSPGIGRSAWFKDPDGNTIAVFQPEQPPPRRDAA